MVIRPLCYLICVGKSRGTATEILKALRTDCFHYQYVLTVKDSGQSEKSCQLGREFDYIQFVGQRNGNVIMTVSIKNILGPMNSSN